MELRQRHLLFALTGILLLFLLLVLFATGLHRDALRGIQDVFGYGGPHSDEATGSRDLFHSGVPIGGLRGGETYGAYDARRDAVAVTAHRGFGCLGDCRAQEAGYRWAAERRIARPRDCAGPSWSFVEGCAALVIPLDESLP